MNITHRLTIVLLVQTKPNADHKGIVAHYGYSDDFTTNVSRYFKQKWEKI